MPKKSSSKRWSRVIIGIVIVIGLSAVVSVVMIRRAYMQNLQPVSSSHRLQLVTIPSGATAKDIALQLKEAGIIRSAWAFEWYIRNNNLRDDLQAGTYNLRPNLSVPDIVEVLTQGKVATDLVTIVPGARIDQIRTSLIEKYGFAQAAVDAALKPDQYAGHPALVDKPVGVSLEGYLYPESFEKTAQTQPETIIKAALDEMQKHLTPDLRAGIVRQGLTVHQGVILASVIEQEVSNPADKKTVAQVFLKRLREDRALQSDPTAFYGAILAGDKPTLTYSSAYNTYEHKGLPPTPISNVSVSSLEAVARPSATDYLFFVAGDDGKTYFSRTISEHEALTRQHCKTLCPQ